MTSDKTPIQGMNPKSDFFTGLKTNYNPVTGQLNQLTHEQIARMNQAQAEINAQIFKDFPNLKS